MSCVLVCNIGLVSNHAEITTISYVSFENQGVYLGWDQNIMTTQIIYLLKYVNQVCRQCVCEEGIYPDMATLQISNKNYEVVIKTCRHADTICMSCVFVSNIGVGSNHADMPTCQNADISYVSF